MRKKPQLFVFQNEVFGPLSLRAHFRPFSSIFFFILCNSSVRAKNHTEGLTNFIFGTETILLKKIKAKRHNCGHRDIIFLYAGSIDKGMSDKILCLTIFDFGELRGPKRPKAAVLVVET